MHRQLAYLSHFVLIQSHSITFFPWYSSFKPLRSKSHSIIITLNLNKSHLFPPSPPRFGHDAWRLRFSSWQPPRLRSPAPGPPARSPCRCNGASDGWKRIAGEGDRAPQSPLDCEDLRRSAKKYGRFWRFVQRRILGDFVGAKQQIIWSIYREFVAISQEKRFLWAVKPMRQLSVLMDIALMTVYQYYYRFMPPNITIPYP